jgi:hypothetical protein
VDQSGSCPGRQPLKALKYRSKKRKYGARKFWFPQAKEFIPKLFAIWARALKSFARTLLGRKSLKNIGFKGRRIISLIEASTNLRPTLQVGNNTENQKDLLFVVQDHSDFWLISFSRMLG